MSDLTVASTDELAVAFRGELQQTLSLDNLQRDLVCIARSVAGALGATQRAEVEDDALCAMRQQMGGMYGTMRGVLGQAQRCAAAVTGDEHNVQSVITGGEQDTARHLLSTHGALLQEALGALRTHSAELECAGAQLRALLEAAHRRHDAGAAQAKSADATCESLQQARAAAWHTHTHLLAALREAGVQHRDARNASRSVRRKASLASLFSFVREPPLACVQPLLEPLTSYLGGIEQCAATAAAEERQLLDAKRRHRASSRAALDDLADATRAIRFLSEERSATARRQRALQHAADALRAAAAALQRVEALFRALHGWCEASLGSRALLRLLPANACAEGAPVPARRRASQYFARWQALTNVTAACIDAVDRAATDARGALCDDLQLQQADEATAMQADDADAMQVVDGAECRPSTEIVDLTADDDVDDNHQVLRTPTNGVIDLTGDDDVKRCATGSGSS